MNTEFLLRMLDLAIEIQQKMREEMADSAFGIIDCEPYFMRLIEAGVMKVSDRDTMVTELSALANNINTDCSAFSFAHVLYHYATDSGEYTKH